MKPEEVINHYGSATKAAKALKLSVAGIGDWGRKGFVPFNTQYRIQVLTCGVLVADREDPNPRHYEKTAAS